MGVVALAVAVAGGMGIAQADGGPSGEGSDSYSTYNYSGEWPEQDIKPWVKCVAVTYFATAKTGSAMSECAGDVDVNYWRDFTGPVTMQSGGTYVETRFEIEGYHQTGRDGSNCPKTSQRARYVKCIKVSGPNGGQDGVVFSVETYSGTDNPSALHVNWDYGW